MELITSILLMVGAGFILTSAIGLLRLPDVLCRSHAVAKALTLGIFLMLMGLWLHLGDPEVGLKCCVAILLQVVTIPVASHLIGLLALRQDLPRWRPRAPSERGRSSVGGEGQVSPPSG